MIFTFKKWKPLLYGSKYYAYYNYYNITSYYGLYSTRLKNSNSTLYTILLDFCHVLPFLPEVNVGSPVPQNRCAPGIWTRGPLPVAVVVTGAARDMDRELRRDQHSRSAPDLVITEGSTGGSGLCHGTSRVSHNDNVLLQPIPSHRFCWDRWFQ